MSDTPRYSAKTNQKLIEELTQCAKAIKYQTTRNTIDRETIYGLANKIKEISLELEARRVVD